MPSQRLPITTLQWTASLGGKNRNCLHICVLPTYNRDSRFATMSVSRCPKYPILVSIRAPMHGQFGRLLRITDGCWWSSKLKTETKWRFIICVFKHAPKSYSEGQQRFRSQFFGTRWGGTSSFSPVNRVHKLICAGSTGVPKCIVSRH